jgi:hypothetical protein
MLSSPYRAGPKVSERPTWLRRHAPRLFGVLQGAVSALVVYLGIACTPAQVAAVTQFTVDACTEIPNFVPPTSVVGQVIGLTCSGLEAGEGVVTVIVDASVWNAMKADYVKAHGALPARFYKTDAGK